MESVGTRIKRAREKKNLTQEELGRICGTTKQTIFKYENNIVTNIPMDRLEEIAKALDTTPSDLLGWSQSENESISEESLSAMIGQEAANAILNDNNKAALVKWIVAQDPTVLSLVRWIAAQDYDTLVHLDRILDSLNNRR